MSLFVKNLLLAMSTHNEIWIIVPLERCVQMCVSFSLENLKKISFNKKLSYLNRLDLWYELKDNIHSTMNEINWTVRKRSLLRKNQQFILYYFLTILFKNIWWQLIIYLQLMYLGITRSWKWKSKHHCKKMYCRAMLKPVITIVR